VTRRSYDWEGIAAMARQSSPTWRLHTDLAAITLETLHHMRRRVPALAADEAGHFEYARGVEAKDDLGVTIFDCFIRYVPEGTDP
jgi:hypothetical protein